MSVERSNWHEGIGNILQVRVTPKASMNAVKVEDNPDGSKLIRVYITTVPEGGKANEAVIKLLAKELGISKSSLTITRGLTSRNKTIHIEK
jgi:uncharacterized protein YggU (UPF0235/DUF167 family)